MRTSEHKTIENRNWVRGGGLLLAGAALALLAGLGRAEGEEFMNQPPVAQLAGVAVTSSVDPGDPCLAAPDVITADASDSYDPEEAPLTFSWSVDGVVVTAPDSRRVRLSHAAALVWALCDGVDDRTLGQDTELLARTHPVYRGLDRERTAGLLAGLLEARLVERKRH